MLSLALVVLAAPPTLQERRVTPVPAAERERLRIDRPVACVQLAPTEQNPEGRYRLQCDEGTHRCLAAPDGKLDAEGRLTEALERVEWCPPGAKLEHDDWPIFEAIAEARPGWYRDERGRIVQVNFDLSRRIFFGGAFAPNVRPDGQGTLRRGSVELGTAISWESSEAVWRLRLLEGSLWLGTDLRLDAQALSLGSTRAVRDAPLFITTFIGTPRRFDVPLALSWGAEAGHVELIGGKVFFAPLELDAVLTLWSSSDHESFVRLRAGPGVEHEFSSRQWAFRPGAALEADLTLDRDGHHHLTGSALWEQRVGGDPGLRLKGRLGYEAIVFAINDYPVTFVAEVRGAWRTDVPAFPGFELAGQAGLRFSLWAPERRGATERRSPRG